MSLNKVLNMLIGMFMLVNIILGITNYNKHMSFNRLKIEQIDTIIELLANKGVQVATELPVSYNPLESIAIKPVDLGTQDRDYFIKRLLNEQLSQVLITKENTSEREQLVYKYEEKEVRFIGNEIHYINHAYQPKDVLTSEKAIFKMGEAFIEKLDIEKFYKNIKIDHNIESNRAELTYYELYKDLPLFDSYVTMEVSAKGIYRAEIKLISKNETEILTQPIYPVNRVLFELFRDEVDLEKMDWVELKAVELGYMIPDGERLHLLEEEAVPVYKIQIVGLDPPIFVNAYTNKLIQD